MRLLTEEAKQDLVSLRRDFHMYPELGHAEHRTAGIVADYLRAIGLDEVRTGVGTTGVVGVLRGGRPGRTVLLRADMDGLPIQEADRGQSYRSRNDGVHHACGHDGHLAILLVVARLLAERRDSLPGTVLFVFQPAEERVNGADGMIAAGALSDPKPDASFALHLWTPLPVGTVGVRPGPVFANADHFTIALTGPGGHGAEPHQTSDPVVAAAALIMAYQTLVSRETAPLQPAALTIGTIHGGSASNIIPTRVDLQGTLRTFDNPLRERLMRRLAEMVASTAETFRVEGTFSSPPGCPACVNDPGMTALAREVAERVVGPDGVNEDTRTLGADDMAYFLDAAPGCYFLVGAGNAERSLDSPHHSPTFDFDEEALVVGVEVLAGIAMEYLERSAASIDRA